ncbi:HAD family hydrolase [Arthrobacter pityocampae]|uniref:HAD family hydrolase n=1 Tax=Arthrobacter pityocampae TaxID=547334 RepID=UPI00373609CC
MTTLTDAGIDDRQENRTQHLVALDIDGTLVDHEGNMTDEVRDAAQAVIGAGHDVIIATGRSLGATLPVVGHLGVTRGYAVCSNGGVTLRLDPALPAGFEVIDRVTFDPKPALSALRTRLPSAKYALEDDRGRFLSTESFQDASFGSDAESVDFEEMLEARAVRVVVFSTDSSAEEFGEAVASIGLHGVTYSVGWTAWLDIAASGVTKASALEILRDRLGTPRELTVAVGDGRNDIEMLQWAGRGVAMGQAPEEVRSVASEVTGTVYDDGAAKVLRSLV